MKKQTAYLLIEPAMDYEDTIDPRIICETREIAEKIQQEIIEYGKLIASKLLNPYWQEISDEEYTRREEHNNKIMEEAKWPYDWPISFYNNFQNNYSEDSTFSFREESVRIIELPIYE